MGWCRKHKRGIKLIEPNENLAKEYIQTAEETLDVLRNIKGKSKVWVAATKYYCEYFAVYSLFMRIGIKCEMHDCTIAFSKLLEENEFLPEGTFDILTKDKKLRIDNQYYLKNRDVPIDYNQLLDFVLKIKNTASKIKEIDIQKIREML